MEQVGFVGCGEMGSMVLTAALQAGVLDPARTVVAERNPDQRTKLSGLGVQLVEFPAELGQCDQIILAVRPQQFAEAVAEIGADDHGRLVISVMAGIGSNTIQTAFGENTRVICVMPNAPVRVHAGMCALMPASQATDEDIAFGQALFGTLGKTVILPESNLWAVTALSGSGPGYLALIAETMVEHAIEMGIDPDVAPILVAETMAGTGRMLAETGMTPARLRAAVATPGGTTEAAINSMIDEGVQQSIRRGIQAAHDRGETLSGG
ncbi:MAG: pyrroline-5-carboxylate reductase [Phycisphaerales bacterium]|nr:pyrroline-5-carboxylate reductase [Phycisphaerales bacterium]